MCRSAWLLAAITAASLLGGCNENAPPVASAPPPPPPPQVATADLSGLPAGAPCTDRINRYQNVLAADHRTGNVNDFVFAEIEHEISDAAAACSAGKGSQALAMVHASQVKHGYHT